jgi:hypothetical protein
LVARKNGAPSAAIAADPAEVTRAEKLLASYVKTRALNCEALAEAAHELESLKPQRVALWGAGRLFDSLVRTGGFDPAELTLLIDAHLIQHMASRHGAKLSPPQALAETPVDVIVVMSRGFADEIVTEARRLAPKARTILYADLLARARLAKAA